MCVCINCETSHKQIKNRFFIIVRYFAIQIVLVCVCVCYKLMGLWLWLVLFFPCFQIIATIPTSERKIFSHNLWLYIETLHFTCFSPSIKWGVYLEKRNKNFSFSNFPGLFFSAKMRIKILFNYILPKRVVINWVDKIQKIIFTSIDLSRLADHEYLWIFMEQP